MKNSSNFIKKKLQIMINFLSILSVTLKHFMFFKLAKVRGVKRRMDTSSMLLLDALCLEKIVKIKLH